MTDLDWSFPSFYVHSHLHVDAASQVASASDVDPDNCMWYYARPYDTNTNPLPYVLFNLHRAREMHILTPHTHLCDQVR